MVKRITLFLLAIMLPFFLFSQTSGKIAGTITSSETGEPISGANVVITDAAYPMGAASGSDGYFVILNIPPGEYTVKVTYMGKKDVILENLQVTGGRTRQVDIAMENATLEGQSVVVQAQRKLVNTDATSSESINSADEIEELPIRPMSDLVGRFYLRFTAVDQPGVLSQISGCLGRNGISIQSMIQPERHEIDSVPIVVMTHAAQEKGITQALREIEELDVISQPTRLIRVENDLG